MQTTTLILVLAVFLQSTVSENIEVPESCKTLTYCTEKPKNYPQERFNSFYKHLDPTKILIEPPPVQDVTLDNRGGGPGQEEDGCQSNITVDPVYLVRENLSKPWRTVVQAPGVAYVQKVRLERCVSPNAPCFKPFLSTAVEGTFRTFCQQLNLYYNFVVEKIGAENQTETINGELPACCSCHYKKA